MRPTGRPVNIGNAAACLRPLVRSSVHSLRLARAYNFRIAVIKDGKQCAPPLTDVYVRDRPWTARPLVAFLFAGWVVTLNETVILLCACLTVYVMSTSCTYGYR
jgi:hypothetical protein